MIVLSNLAFPSDAEPAFFAKLVREGLAGIEVAPTRLAPWSSLTEKKLLEYRAQLLEVGLQVPSLQAIFFGLERTALLGDRQAFINMLEHLRRVCGVAASLGAGIAVFGAPSIRNRGSISLIEATKLGAERFHCCAELVHGSAGLVLGLEPVPTAYGSDFLTSAGEVLAMVKTVNHPGLKLHLDTACVLLGDDDIATAIIDGVGWLVHFHAAEPELREFSKPLNEHKSAAAALKQVGYRGAISIEMREAADWGNATLQAVRHTRQVYFESADTSRSFNIENTK